MRIAFASEHPNQISAFSGIPYYMSRAISADSEYFEYIQCPCYKLEQVRRGCGWSEIERIGKFLSERLQTMDVDAVICQGSSMIPFLKTNKTVILWHDSTWFSLMQMNFEEFKSQYPLLYEWDRITLERCDLLAFAADWVRDQVIAHYHVVPRKVHVLPFGPNMEPVSQQAVADSIASRKNTTCHLAFLGVDWLRKGLPLAHGVMTRLNKNENGVRAELSVIGCDIPTIGLKRQVKHYMRYRPFKGVERFQMQYSNDTAVKKIGFLSKDVSSQYHLFREIIQNTHFLLHPASFECFGIALVEANAFGVPVLATDNSGPRTIIRDGLNGHLFQQNEYVDCASDLITHYMNDFNSYKSLALSSFREYRDRLNWSTSYRKLKELLIGTTK
jgi:glycosyltransferase involved in cell wall biosynthesis